MGVDGERCEWVCEKHPNKMVEYVCLDSKCQEPTRGCLLCFRKNHEGCQDGLIISVYELDVRVRILQSDVDSRQVVERLEKVFDAKIAELVDGLNSRKKKLIQTVLERLDQKGPETLESVDQMKRDLDIALDKSTNIVMVKPRGVIDSHNVKDMRDRFECGINKRISTCLKEFSTLSIEMLGEPDDKSASVSLPESEVHIPLSPSPTKDEILDPKNWDRHSNVVCEKFLSGLIFKRASSDSKTDFFCAVLKLPLTSACKFKISVLSVYEMNKSFGIGIVGERKFAYIEKNSMVNYYYTGETMIVYTGTGRVGSLMGKIPVDDQCEKKALRPGGVFFMEYVPRESLRFFNEDTTLDLHRDLRYSEESFYLYVDLAFQGTSFVIEVVE